MKLIIVSDSHGSKKALDEIYEKNYKADIFLHLGDYELPDYMLFPFTAVRGNCDYSSLNPLYKDIEINKIKIHLEHGNNPRLLFDFNNYIISLNTNIFLFGHTHTKLVSKINNTLLLNPGSLTKPRDSLKGSYIELDIDNDSNISYKFIDYLL